VPPDYAERQQQRLAAQLAEYRPERATHSLEEAAWLRFAGCELRRMERAPEGKVTFIFEDTPLLRRARDDWFGGQARADIRQFTRTLRDLRSQVLRLRNSACPLWVAVLDTTGDSLGETA
jgi:hypothetical protein